MTGPCRHGGVSTLGSGGAGETAVLYDPPVVCATQHLLAGLVALNAGAFKILLWKSVLFREYK